MTDTLVIGAGMAGLACARTLKQAGRTVCVLDKGRGTGGRMSTRRAHMAEMEFGYDHGAQFFTIREPAFASLLAELEDAARPWADGADHQHHVGVPGMSGLPQAMAAGLDVRLGTRVTSLARQDEGWRVATDHGEFVARRVVLTVPAPQVAPLIGENHPLVAELAHVRLAPCWTLMAAFAADSPTPFVNHKPDRGPLDNIARDSSKPGRSDQVTTWVAQADPEWSQRHLEEEKASVVAQLLPRLCEAIGTATSDAVHVDAHRWRYARVTRPLGEPFLRDTSASLYLGGDWCLAPRVEAAWASGTAIAREILGAPP
ncbi:FAD-dependent oxidoreductase [Halomonas sp. 18H]|uniref:NAD(P)/FAD-dependent oxidoreductase n=1 Tax=Halomonas almeriensis TaxID=308163 RepID=UPI00222F75DB|nr:MULTISPECIES: FAD-dependent oxidoreductase [Halomonas]MCW4149292.1 FAD-dependent oxidoreductase [Halomonas sp. 18H]MDN3552155.1 FAD-dependent oxidoreductase [Halomonas almeriensis]